MFLTLIRREILKIQCVIIIIMTFSKKKMMTSFTSAHLLDVRSSTDVGFQKQTANNFRSTTALQKHSSNGHIVPRIFSLFEAILKMGFFRHL